ncbi:MAG: hypothetical protein QF795_03580 [Candidatus Marinimicrobia bacterium]|jgi:hypothetical protein|nr:hypothetical protein [Candidatus Neomarinimicrobiota bacterium]|tara:strand:+ start:172 stop:582 length:411 start_codon:yes stop_codon:yes gene_type:complete
MVLLPMLFLVRNFGFVQIRTILFFIFITGCSNMPTPQLETMSNDGLTPSLDGSHNTGLEYESYDCQKLYNEIISLNDRENQLVIAIENNMLSGRWYRLKNGLISGDGIIISELNIVRAKKEVARNIFEKKGCIITK